MKMEIIHNGDIIWVEYVSNIYRSEELNIWIKLNGR